MLTLTLILPNPNSNPCFYSNLTLAVTLTLALWRISAQWTFGIVGWYFPCWHLFQFQFQFHLALVSVQSILNGG